MSVSAELWGLIVSFHLSILGVEGGGGGICDVRNLIYGTVQATQTNPNTHICFNIKCTLIQTERKVKKSSTLHAKLSQRFKLNSWGFGAMTEDRHLSFLSLPPRFRLVKDANTTSTFVPTTVCLAIKLKQQRRWVSVWLECPGWNRGRYTFI